MARPLTRRRPSGPGTRKAAAASRTSTGRSPAPPTRRSCRSAGIRCSSIRWRTPNGVKVTVMLEELLALGHAGAEYDAWLIRINDGDQFGSGFVAVNPNSKIPALLDRSGADADPRVRVGRDPALPGREVRRASCRPSAAARAECLSWLFWQMGSAPFLGGGFGHFYAYAPSKIEYAIDRYAMEVKRQLDVLDRRLAESRVSGGRRLHDRRHRGLALVRHAGQGPALRRGRVPRRCRTTSNVHALDRRRSRSARRCSAAAWSTAPGASPSSQLHERHDASDFDTQHRRTSCRRRLKPGTRSPLP